MKIGGSFALPVERGARRASGPVSVYGAAAAGIVAQIFNQLCSARKTPAAFCLSLLARNERGESWREGKFDKRCLLSPALLLLFEEERAGERRLFLSNFPSLQLSPRSFLARRERQNAAGVLRAEHN